MVLAYVKNDVLGVNIVMQLLALVLVLVNIGAVLGPVAGVAIIYRDNLAGLVVPPEVTQLVNETTSAASQIQLPQLLNYTYDQNAKTVTVVFTFTNPLSLNVTVNSLAADVICNEHNVLPRSRRNCLPSRVEQEHNSLHHGNFRLDHRGTGSLYCRTFFAIKHQRFFEEHCS